MDGLSAGETSSRSQKTANSSNSAPRVAMQGPQRRRMTAQVLDPLDRWHRPFSRVVNLLSMALRRQRRVLTAIVAASVWTGTRSAGEPADRLACDSGVLCGLGAGRAQHDCFSVADARASSVCAACRVVRLRGGNAKWAQDAGYSSEMAETSEIGDLEDEGPSLHPSQLDLSDATTGAVGADADARADPTLLAERYWALPARSRQLLDDLVRFKWKQVTNESVVTFADGELHRNDTEPLTGMKLEEVWDGDEQRCVRVVEAHLQSGVQAGDVLRTVEGIDCSEKSIAEVGHLIAEANGMKTSVNIGMLRNSIYANTGPDSRSDARADGAAGAAEHMYSLTLERGWLLPDKDTEVSLTVFECELQRLHLPPFHSALYDFRHQALVEFIPKSQDQTCDIFHMPHSRHAACWHKHAHTVTLANM